MPRSRRLCSSDAPHLWVHAGCAVYTTVLEHESVVAFRKERMQDPLLHHVDETAGRSESSDRGDVETSASELGSPVDTVRAEACAVRDGSLTLLLDHAVQPRISDFHHDGSRRDVPMECVSVRS
jgi:hypothetical protein